MAFRLPVLRVCRDASLLLQRGPAMSNRATALLRPLSIQNVALPQAPFSVTTPSRIIPASKASDFVLKTRQRTNGGYHDGNSASENAASAATAAESATTPNASSSASAHWLVLAGGAMTMFILNAYLEKNESKTASIFPVLHAMAETTDSFGGNFALPTEPEENNGKKKKKNPGKFEDMSRASKDVLHLDVQDGLRVDVGTVACYTKSKQFFISHHLGIGSQQAPEGSYELSATYVNADTVTLSGRMDAASGRMQGQLRLFDSYPVGGGMVFAVGPDGTANFQMDSAVKFPDSTFSVKGIFDQNIYAVDYLQAVHSRVDIGTRIDHIADRGMTITTIGGRWTPEKEDWTAQLSSLSTADIAYVRHVSPNISAATGVVVMPQGSLFQIGWAYRYRQSTARGVVDSNGKVTGQLDMAVAQNAKLSVVAEVNAISDETAFGATINVEV